MKYLVTLLLVVSSFAMAAQTDSIAHRLRSIEHRLHRDTALRRQYEDLTFYYNQMFRQQWDSIQSSGFKLTGYVDAYYAHYSDSVGVNIPQKFPTAAPYSDAFGLNMAMLQGRYRSEKVRGSIALHVGDIASTAWSSVYNLVQEANAGVALSKRLWLDAGFFRTHLGFESIQPRENITTSIATTTYFEPYFLSGAKLSFRASSKLVLQVSAFNGFNTYVETNRKKTLGFTANYEFNDHAFISYNVLAGDETQDNARSQKRLYQNIYFGRVTPRLDVGAEANFGIQTNSRLSDSTATATMFSALVAAKYKMHEGKYALYARAEIFEDSDEILTGPVRNEKHQLVGINIIGFTAGVEYRPTPKSYLRFESRQLDTQGDERIFITRNTPTGQRIEFIAAMGAWF